ncbi:MAG: alpha/beta hydrolase [Alphaproteobacteria bacterium]
MADEKANQLMTGNVPDRLQFLSEVPRAGAEAAAFAMAWPLLTRLPQGDGHTVMVLPGFTANDTSTLPLRRLLSSLGYDAHGWDQGTNMGRAPGQREALLARLDELHGRSGRKISLIGQSLGGIFARELARARPQQTRLVISLGSPFSGSGVQGSNLWPFVEQITGRTAPEVSPAVRRRLAEPLQVPMTAIYSRGDGVVDWRACLQKPLNNTSENIEVRGSHSGMAVNPSVVLAIADRLAQPEFAWRKFRFGGVKRLIFPTPSKV